MPSFQRDDVSLYYEVHGEGFPVLLFAPGGMRSAVPFWDNAPFNPIEVLSADFRVIAMDQRNTGRSRAPVGPDHGWHTYTADHLALLDHLEVERCHVLGGCIGGPYCFGVMQAAPDRVAAGVIQQTIGLSPDNRQAFHEMFDAWKDNFKKHHPQMSDADWRSFRANMYDGDFLFNVDRDFIRGLQTPLLVLMGADLYHPTPISREVAELAQNATLVERWKDAEVIADTVTTVRDFLLRNTPAAG